MGQNSTTLHEPAETLSPESIDCHRAIVSLMEELEAADWYDQRVQACSNDELRSILAHNRDEEKEHAAMVLEWLRRNDPVLDKHLKTFLFTDGPIVGREKATESSAGESSSGSLGIGSLRSRASKEIGK
jgi:ferritin-like protein